MPYAEIVASVSSSVGGAGHPGQHRRVHQDHQQGVETIGGAARGKAIIILNPADPPMIMRDTIFCAIPEDADRDAIAKSIREVVAEVQTYVPGYRLLNEPQFDEPSMHSGGQAVVTTFVEVEGAGDYLPPYAGNLDIMTAAATKVGEEIAKETLSVTGGPRVMTGDSIWDVRITDTSLRDGSHHKRHQFTKEEVSAIVAALDAAGVPVIEVTHGDGLGGSSFNYGFSKTPEQELIKLAAETAKEAKIAFLMLPGVGTKEDIKAAQDNGGSICRIATHCTEADVSIQHFGLARELGLETVGFLMMAHTIPPEKLAARPASWPTPVASASTSSTRPVRWCSTAWPTGCRRWSPNSARTPKSASTGTRTSGWGWPTRWRRCARAPSRSTAACAASVRARATRRSRP